MQRRFFFSSKSDHLKFYDFIWAFFFEEDLSDKNHTLEIGVSTILYLTYFIFFKEKSV